MKVDRFSSVGGRRSAHESFAKFRGYATWLDDSIHGEIA
jgi:hypothetical protein